MPLDNLSKVQLKRSKKKKQKKPTERSWKAGVPPMCTPVTHKPNQRPWPGQVCKPTSLDGAGRHSPNQGSQRNQTNKTPGGAPAGDARPQPPARPNLPWTSWCCCSCGTGAVYLSDSKCLSVWQPAEYIKQALQTLNGPGSE